MATIQGTLWLGDPVTPGAEQSPRICGFDCLQSVSAGCGFSACGHGGFACNKVVITRYTQSSENLIDIGHRQTAQNPRFLMAVQMKRWCIYIGRLYQDRAVQWWQLLSWLNVRMKQLLLTGEITFWCLTLSVYVPNSPAMKAKICMDS